MSSLSMHSYTTGFSESLIVAIPMSIRTGLFTLLLQ